MFFAVHVATYTLLEISNKGARVLVLNWAAASISGSNEVFMTLAHLKTKN